MNNPLGCNTLYPHGPLESAREQFDVAAHTESIRIVRSAGFDGCEFSHYDVLSVEECARLRSDCDRIGLIPWSAHTWVQLPAEPERADTQLTALRESVQRAGALGVQVLVAHAARGSIDLSDPEQRQRRRTVLARALTSLAHDLAAHNLTLAIENCAGRDDMAFLVETVAGLDLDCIGFNVDTGHAVLHGMTPSEVIGMMDSRLRTTHLQDNFGERDDHLPPGEGNIDWEATLRSLTQVGYEGMLMVEISDRPPGREPDAVKDTQTAYDNLSRLARV